METRPGTQQSILIFNGSLAGCLETHPGLEAHPAGYVETHQGMEAHPAGYVETHPGMEAHPAGCVETHPGASGNFFFQRASSNSSKC